MVSATSILPCKAGAFPEYWPVQRLRLRSEVRQGIGGETGVTSDVFLDAIVPVGQFRLSAGPSADSAIHRGRQPVFQHHSSPVDRLYRRRLPTAVSIHTAPEARWNISSISNRRRTASLNFSG